MLRRACKDRLHVQEHGYHNQEQAERYIWILVDKTYAAAYTAARHSCQYQLGCMHRGLALKNKQIAARPNSTKFAGDVS